jgi:hypothetical protein
VTATLLMEHLMTHPRYPELVERLRAITPPAAVDQADAAAADALATLTAVVDRVGADGVHGIHPGDLPGWLRLSVLDAFTNWLSGRADTCRHNPTPQFPRPVFAAAWRPGLIICSACTHLVSLPRGTDADATCDGCGYRCGGVDAADPIYPSMVQLGPLVFMYGTCTGCTPSINEPPATVPARRRPRPRRPRGRR